MPKYSFHCNKCDKTKLIYTSSDTKKVSCECGSEMDRSLPNIAIQRVTETVDTYTNIKRDQNHDEMIKQRRDDYYWNIEVPRLIQRYSLKTCLEQQWLKYNDKGELEINKPPSKR
jgi:putative FmdB family regulatory protein